MSSKNIIDSRELIERFEELEEERETLLTNISEATEALEDEQKEDTSDETIVGELQDKIAEHQATLVEWDDENGEEYRALKALIDEAENYGDFQDGEALIHEDYFETYARELADDLGLINKNSSWPYTCIDWERAADELKADYTVIEFMGDTYYMRA